MLFPVVMPCFQDKNPLPVFCTSTAYSMKKRPVKKRLHKIVGLLLLLVLQLAASAQLTPQEAILLMQKGINIGNTMEAQPTEGSTTAPKIKASFFDKYKEAGFQCVRIPIRWDQYTGTSDSYSINESWINRVEEVIDWGLARGLFIIINAHHDDWIKNSTDYDTNILRFESIWRQISERFKNKSDRLVFEILNEPNGLTKEQNDDLHSRILSIIRKTNPTRLVIIQGNGWANSGDLINIGIPKDNYIIGSFHSYDPYGFAAKGGGLWGTSDDIWAMRDKVNSVKNWSVAHNIPVIIGEFGAITQCDYNSRMLYYRYWVSLCKEFGIAFSAWDTNNSSKYYIFKRPEETFTEVKDILIYSSKESPNPVITVHQDSIVRLNWTNVITGHENIIIQRRLKSQDNYQDIGILPPGANQYDDVKPAMDQTYRYRVIAKFSLSDDLYSHPIEFHFPKWVRPVIPVRKPFNNYLPTIPGTIEAENFDLGGEGLAYHDSEFLNQGGEYRPNEGVDIYKRISGGYHIGQAVPGEWYSYSVSVTEAGTYNVSVNVAAMQSGGTFKISVGSAETEILQVTSANSWLTTRPVLTKMNLKAGEQILRIEILGSPLFNLDNLQFTQVPTHAVTLNLETEKFEIYRNLLGEIVVKFNQSHFFHAIRLFNVSGQLLSEINAPGDEAFFFISHLQRGMYIIEGISSKGKFSMKIII